MYQAPNIQPEYMSEEKYFQSLRNAMVQAIIIREGIREDDIRAAIRDIIDSFRPPRRDQPGRGFLSIDLAPLPYGCAYVQHHGTLGMGLARDKVLQALQNCQALRDKFSGSADPVNVVCLGGGPGTDVVGLTSALYEYGIRSALNITVVDSVMEWYRFMNDLQAFIRGADFGNVTKYFNENIVNLSFMQDRLPSQDASVQAIQEADVILMIRFLSSVRENPACIIQHVRRNMSNGAIALVVNSPFYEDNYMWAAFDHLYVQPWSDDPDDWFHLSAPLLDEASTSKALLAVLRRNMQREAQMGLM